MKKSNSDSDKPYKSLFEQAGDAIFRGNFNGSFIQVNSAACKLTGFSNEELLLMNMKDLFTKDQFIKKPLRYDLLNESSSIITERNILTKTGESIPVEMNSKKVDNSSYLSIMRNISYRKTIEKNLKDNEEKFRKLFSAAPDGILLLDKKGNIVDCNQAYCDLLKYDKKDIINTHVSHSICKNDKDLFIEKYPNLIITGKAEGEICLKTKYAKTICTWRSAAALFDENGTYNGAIVHTHDITDQKKARNKIEEREARLNAIFNAADSVSFILTTAHGENSIVTEFSPGSEKMFGYTKEEMLGKPISLLHTIDSLINFSNYLKKLKKGKEGFKGQSIMVKKSGDKINVIHTAYPILDSSGKLSKILAVTIDITEQKKLEDQLRHSHKMEAIGLMASGMAHNFNNILQAIVGYISFAKEGLEETSQRYRDIDQINQHVNRAAAHTKELLAVGKEQFMSKHYINLVNTITPIIELVTRTTGTSITFVFNPKKIIPKIHADEKQIDQVIRNIIINAKDAMPTGGTITISTKKVILDYNFCKENTWAKLGKYIKLSIADTGQGMSQEVLSRIFEPYFTTKEMDIGTGLGLSTTFGIISQHNGLINVTSEVNIGSTFDIYLPL